MIAWRTSRTTLLASAAFALGIATPAGALAQYCPSYTPAGTSGGQNCGINPVQGTNPDVPTWQQIFKKVSGGKASWGTDGPDIGTMGSGCGKPKPITDVPARFPCHVLKAIAMQESGWYQFCKPTAPASEVGKPERTIISFDCGYGIGQVTSGMHVGENPAFDRQRVASDPTYNLATGTLILLSKWRAAECVGDNNPDIVEDWYTAIWAYNGLAYVNNPNNPNLGASRGVYNPGTDNGASFTYQERVFGWMEHPKGDRWPVLEVAYPNRGDVGGGGSPNALPEPSCASPTNCTQKRSTHASSCGGPDDTDAGSNPGGDDASTPNPPSDDGGSLPPPSGEPDGGNANPDSPSPTTPNSSGPQTLKQSGDSGCSCRSAGASSTPSSTGLFAAGAFAGVLVWRRKRRSRLLSS